MGRFSRQFHVREIFSRGGMATIYRAEDLLNERREVALKVPLLRVESDPAAFARFRHEEEIGLGSVTSIDREF